MTYAHCLRSGEIILSNSRNIYGYLMIASGEYQTLWKKLDGRARLSYDGGTWLVPGLPEADTEFEAVAAVEAFEARMSVPLR